MAVEVRIPTILRTYTGGEKVVQGAGDTLTALLDDLDSRHTGLLGGLETKIADGDNVTVLPAVAGG
jgi:molybdopterin converting factor small subunit